MQFKPAMTASMLHLRRRRQRSRRSRFPGRTSPPSTDSSRRKTQVFPLGGAILTQSNSNFDPATQQAVSLRQSRRRFANTTFTGSDGGFGSELSQRSEAQASASGILEGQAHNNVHGNVGGFMGDFPFDGRSDLHGPPRGHHRLWWWAGQADGRRATDPADVPCAVWQQEPFLFFANPKASRHAEHGRRLRRSRPVQLHRSTAGSGSITASSRPPRRPSPEGRRLAEQSHRISTSRRPPSHT